MPKPSVKVGDRFTTNEGYEVEVVDYRNADNVIIRFTGSYSHTRKVTVDNMRKGQVKNPYHKSVFGIGYIGHGEHKPSIKSKTTKVYRVWLHILERAYCPKYHKRFPTYVDCSVDDRWHNFQNFSEWYYQQPNSDRSGFHLDKDLLVIGNKVYGPETCTFVPLEINVLLTNSSESRGRFPRGVSRNKSKYVAEISIRGKKKGLGYYATPEEAGEVYREAKEKYVREQAEKYKDVLHPKVYYNLMNYNLEELEKE